jgi:Cu2+-containing amine oxidase
MSNVISEANWKFHWRLTESAGIMIYLAEYRGRRVLWEASMPYVTIDHQRDDIEVGSDGLDTRGPWWVPLGTRTLAGNVRVQPFRGGIELSANFVAGPYSYMQLWRFHDDGRMCPWLTVYGAGVHDQHTYHPHWRFDFDLDGAGHDALEYFADGTWVRVEEEGWFPHTGEADENGFVWRQVDFGTRSVVNLRPHTWDDAELFAVRYHDGEWAPFSPRSAAGAAPFPAAYVGREPLEDQDVALWYVAHVHFDQSFPYTAGPWIKLDGFGHK